MSTKLLIADDYEAVRKNIRSFVDRDPDIEVVAEAQDGKTAVELALKLSPDVVLLDINMPELSGIEAAGKILSHDPAARVIIMSTRSEKTFVEAALEAGARGYVLKTSIVDDLVPAIQRATKNEVFLSPKITDVEIRDRKKPPPRKTDDTDSKRRN